MKPSSTMLSHRTALLGILCALAAALSFLEGMLPALPIPGAKLGLSNVVTMFVLTSLGFPSALVVAVVKAVFALMRGGTAFFMSLSGGLASTLLMAGVWKLAKNHLSFIGMGVVGAVAHNVGQLGAALLILSPSLIYYAPWLLLAALGTGLLTGITLNFVMPKLDKLVRWIS